MNLFKGRSSFTVAGCGIIIAFRTTSSWKSNFTVSQPDFVLASDSPRYLAAFNPKNSPHYFTDVLIIGGGLAGLQAANAIGPDLAVLVVTKDQLRQSNSTYAQGGIAGVLDPQDDIKHHIQDTLVAGGALCKPEIVEMVVREGPSCIQQLVQWGTRFDREEQGELVLGLEGGHSHHRVVHALGDSTGREVMRAMMEWTRNMRNVQIWENSFTIDLLTDGGACRGAVIKSPRSGTTMVWAKQTILCTGGAGQVYRESTNPDVATGDGHALAYRAGAELRDMEFMQFHPTMLYIAGSSRSLITEAVRGEGAHLVDRHGHRFMSDYDERGELAPRDVVAHSIVSQMEKTRQPSVYLDLSHLDGEFVKNRFPGIAATCRKFGIDVTTDQIPVRPGAHYMIGGVTVDEQGRTTVPGLWAAGEVTSSGLHGANRLASNSLLEGLVYGMHVGRGAAEQAARVADSFHALPLENRWVQQTEEPFDLWDIRNSLKSLMWRSLGVRRQADQMRDAAETIDGWCSYVFRAQFREAAGWELQNMLTVSRVMVAAALAREESRGVHLRNDFPAVDDENWLRHQTFAKASSP